MFGPVYSACDIAVAWRTGVLPSLLDPILAGSSSFRNRIPADGWGGAGVDFRTEVAGTAELEYAT